MTESHEDGHHIVRVRAQVMIRDDSTGGWVPMGGGGLSNVSVRKRAAASCDLDPCGKHEYLIFGKRISDQSVVLSCIIKKDFEYNKVMPTFHHWKTGEKKFGLTFQTAADARAFDKGLRTAVDELLDGITEPPPVHTKIPAEAGDDDVFMTLNLPVETTESRSSSDSSTTTTATRRHHTPPYAEMGGGMPPPPPRVKTVSSENESSPSAEHHYTAYVPLMGEGFRKGDEKDKKLIASGEPMHHPFSSHHSSTGSAAAATGVLAKGQRSRCRYCQELFTAEENRSGACAYAPDWGRSVIDSLACVRCAQCMLYHCAGEGELGSCRDGCNRRWLGLAVLSILMPCLWLYPGLRACHWCGLRCGVCGGRHQAAS